MAPTAARVRRDAGWLRHNYGKAPHAGTNIPSSGSVNIARALVITCIDAKLRAALISLCRVAAARCCAVIFGCHRLRTARCHSVPYGRAALHIRFSDWAILCGLGNDMNRRRTARRSDQPMPSCSRAVLRRHIWMSSPAYSALPFGALWLRGVAYPVQRLGDSVRFGQ